MSDSVLLLLVAFAVLLCLNVPVAIAIGLSAFLMLESVGGLPTAYVVAQRLSLGLSGFPLLAIPFFIFAGYLMGEGGMAKRLVTLAAAVVGRLPGGLAYVNTLACMLFGAVSGSATAAVSSIGGFLIPEMEKRGYRREFAVALTATSATTGLLIPPSNIMIVYAVAAGNVSVAALFLAGVLPGILVGLCLMVTTFFVLRGKTAALAAGEVPALGPALVGGLPGLLLILLVIGGILGGIFSPTEASAIAVVYALVLAIFFYREISWQQLPAIVLKSAKTTAVVLLVVGASAAMSWALASESVPQSVSEALLGVSSEALVVLLLINLMLLIVGMFMDMTPAVLIFTPILLPAVTALGVDPVHFGIIMIANLCLGLCTPPVGTCLFVGCSVGKTSIAKVTGPALPFFVAMGVALLVITAWPALSLALPAALNR